MVPLWWSGYNKTLLEHTDPILIYPFMITHQVGRSM